MSCWLRNYLPLENWNKKLDYEDNRIDNTILLDKINEYKLDNNMNNNINIIKDKNIKKYKDYINQTIIFIKNILNKIDMICNTMKLKKNEKLKELINNYNLYIQNLNINYISNIISKELDNVNENIKRSSILKDNQNNTESEIIKVNLIKNQSELEFIVNRIIEKANDKKIYIDLIYKASVDSDRAESFHNRCDSAKSSIVLIETVNGRRFGGYTSRAWKGDGLEKKDPNAFAFSLDKMKTYKVIQNTEAIGCYPDYGAVFLGCQIRIYDNAFTNGGSTFTKGVVYLTNEDFELSGREKIFQIKEI